MQLPVRKCYHYLKVFLLVSLIVACLSFFNGWHGMLSVMLFSPPKGSELYEMQIAADEARIRPNLGLGGEPAVLEGEEKRLGEESLKKYAMNVYLSDRIPYFRKIKDTRHPDCKKVLYDAELPSTSVIIIFHNEPYSVVVRTVRSVLETVRRDDPIYWNARFTDATGKRMALGYPNQNLTSPYLYIKEIILVDDASTLIELKGKLEYYMKTRVGHDLVKIIRIPKRGGLTRARLAGIERATGEIAVFLDAHCEPVLDWLRPLLQRMKQKRDAIIIPHLEVICLHEFQHMLPPPLQAAAKDILVRDRCLFKPQLYLVLNWIAASTNHSCFQAW